MPKAFLFHSSKDKTLVRAVASRLNAANIHYDELTFEEGTASADAIMKGLSESDLFVLFASHNSLSSDWVSSEIRQASMRVMSGALSHIIVFIIDDSDPKKHPEWLLDFVYRKQKNAEIISNIIRARLIELDLDQVSYDEFFVGREDQLGLLKKALSRPSSVSPVCIQLSGWDGIGRRTLAKKAIAETYPWLSRISPEVTLDEGESDSGLYRALLLLRDDRPLGETQQLLHAFEDDTEAVRLDKVVAELSWFAEQKQVIYIRSRSSVLQDNGDFHGWLSNL